MPANQSFSGEYFCIQVAAVGDSDDLPARVDCLLLLLLLLLAAMTYNQVHYFRVNHLADFTQNGHTKIPVG